MYKMAILDLDGTLLNNSGKISEFNEKALRSISNEVSILLASARGMYRIEHFNRQLGTDNDRFYTIAYNGAMVYRNDGLLVSDNKISNILPLVDLYRKYSENPWIIYTADSRLGSDRILDVPAFLSANSIYKVVITDTAENIQTIRSSLSQEHYDNYQVTSSEVTRIEFVEKGMTKLNAIKDLLDKLGISQQETIACGDGENDMDIIEFAGCGVAMGNAPDSVKAIADIVADTNENDGVGKTLLELTGR